MAQKKPNDNHRIKAQAPVQKKTHDKAFSLLKENALNSSSDEEMDLETLASDLHRYLNKNHRRQMEAIEEKIAKIEERVCEEVKETLKAQLNFTFEARFKKVIEHCDERIANLFSSTIEEANCSLEAFKNSISQTKAACHDIQQKYAFKWTQPFWTLLLSASLGGAIMGLMLYLMQISTLSVFLMNAETREIYDMGVEMKKFRESLKK